MFYLYQYYSTVWLDTTPNRIIGTTQLSSGSFEVVNDYIATNKVEFKFIGKETDSLWSTHLPKSNIKLPICPYCQSELQLIKEEESTWNQYQEDWYWKCERECEIGKEDVRSLK